MKISFKVSEVQPRIFFFDFKNRYDCNMFFLRYQEYYESPNSKFRGKSFTLLDFMKWYSSEYGNGAFTYMVDWAGFNIPGHVVINVWNAAIPDLNIYDYEMIYAYRKCLEKYPDGKFYIIGAVGKGVAFNHEIAHGLFYTQPKYKKAMTAEVKKLNPEHYQSMCESLKKMGYTPKVYIDECQAYLATGFGGYFELKMKKEQKIFQKIYKEFSNV